MTAIPKEVKDAIEREKTFVLTTADKASVPNAAYIAYLKTVEDDKILIADNYFDKTRKNLNVNNKVSIIMLDEQKGSYQIKGTAQCLTEGKYFDEMKEWVDPKHPAVQAVVVTVEEVYNGSKRLA